MGEVEKTTLQPADPHNGAVKALCVRRIRVGWPKLFMAKSIKRGIHGEEYNQHSDEERFTQR